MKSLIAVITAALLLIASTAAEAKHRHHSHKHYSSHSNGSKTAILDFAAIPAYPTSQTRQNRVITPRRHIDPTSAYTVAEGIVPNPSGCPRSAFCGCGASVRIFGHPVRDLYLAANWFRFAHASAAAGMVAVRNHHVFVIESVNGDGTVVAYDANSGGHKTRIHTVSLKGYSVRDPHSRQVASR